MQGSPPSAVLLIGIPASGKSTFYLHYYFNSHVRINRDQLKTRHREKLLFEACLMGRQSFVVDNTNFARETRVRFIGPSKDAGFRVIGYFFDTNIADALERNRRRQGRARIPDRGVRGIAGRLEIPTTEEGFDELWHVSLDANGGFVVSGHGVDAFRFGNGG